MVKQHSPYFTLLLFFIAIACGLSRLDDARPKDTAPKPTVKATRTPPPPHVVAVKPHNR